MEGTLLHHICVVLIVLWILSTFNYTHPFFFFISLAYLYLVHERYVLRLRRSLRFDERKNSFQRRVLSDSESVRWLNYAVEKIWPVCMEKIVSEKVLLPIIPWFLDKYKPWTVKEAVVQQLYMGRSPPILTEMRVVPQSTGDDHLVMELGMSFRTAEDMDAILAVKLTKRLGFGIWTRLHLTGLHVEGKVLVGVKFLRHWPFIGRLRVCFVEPPYFQMIVKPIFHHGLDVTELPGIAGWLDKLLGVAFEQTLVEPNMLVVDMEKFVSPQQEPWFSVDEKEPIAYATVEVIDAADLKAADLNGLSDPYVKGQLGPFRFRTKTQKKTLSPKWHEEFKVPICTWESSNDLAIEVGDKDRFLDDLLGNCSVPITDLRGGQRHEMWLPLKNVKTGRLHLAITVVEVNKKVPDKKCDGEIIDGDKNENTIGTDAPKGSVVSSRMSQKSPKVTDEYEPINIEGQEETGIWVHHPGSEVTQIWEPRKGKSRLLDSQILGEGSFRSTVTGNNDSSSTDGSQDGHKENRRNKVVRGLKKFGSLFRRSSRKLDASSEIGSRIPSPHANIKALNEKDCGVKLIVDDPDIVLPSPLDVPRTEYKDGMEGEHHQSPGEKVKDKAKSILKHAGKSAHKIKHTFSREGSNKFEGESNLEVIDKNLDKESESSDEGSVPTSVSTTEVEGVQVGFKSISTSGSDSSQSETKDQKATTAEDLMAVVSNQDNQNVNNDQMATIVEDPMPVVNDQDNQKLDNDQMAAIADDPMVVVSDQDNKKIDNDFTINDEPSVKEIASEVANKDYAGSSTNFDENLEGNK